MLSQLEHIEEFSIKNYGIKSVNSKGRKIQEKAAFTRTCFQRDRDRIIHSKAFRRLKHKTQVFIATTSDHYRSRLTHTLEVAQISRHLARLLRVNEDLAECIALAHDLGHPPFGHSGEFALNILMKNHGGFEHNLQSIKVIEFLESKYPCFPGLNLSHEIIEGLKKHSTPWDQPQLETCESSIESQIVNIADEIAYNNHDLDDGINSTFLHPSELTTHITLWKEAKLNIKEQYTNLEPHQLNHLINSYIISLQVEDIFKQSLKNLSEHHIKSTKDVFQMKKPLIAFSSEMSNKNNELRNYLFKNLYQHPRIKESNIYGKTVVTELFNYYLSNFSIIPEDYITKYDAEIPKETIICDFISGMTDSYAIKQHKKIQQAI